MNPPATPCTTTCERTSKFDATLQVKMMLSERISGILGHRRNIARSLGASQNSEFKVR
jgi:hypothetical protein